MRLTNVLTPILSVIGLGVGGWLGYRMRAYNERRAALGTALADLLEIRHRILAIDFIVQYAIKQGVPNEVAPQVRTVVEALVPQGQDQDVRYTRAMAALAGVDPITAYHLQSQNLLPRAITAWRSLALQNQLNTGDIERLETELLQTVKPHLDEAVLDLAKAHSFGASRAVRAIVKKKFEMPDDLQRLLLTVKAIAEKQATPQPPAQGGGQLSERRT